MKNDSLTYSSISFLLILSTVLLLSCSSADNKTTVTEKQDDQTDTAYLVQSNADSSKIVREAMTVEENQTVRQIEEAPTTTPGAGNTAVTNEPGTAKQATATEKPAVIPAPAKKPEVAPAVTQPIPSAEPEPEPAPAPLPASSIVQQFGFTLKSTKAIIKGTSSLHAWESNVTQIQGKGSFETKDDKLIALNDVEIRIPVTGIQSKEGSRMDNKTYETFKSDQHPTIVYRFSNAAVNVNASNAVTVEAPGQLSMAGKTQSVPLTATGRILPNGDLQMSFSRKLKMTDFNMDPPVMMLGTIRVGDEITVDFDFVLERTK